MCLANILNNKNQAISQRYLKLRLDDQDVVANVLKIGVGLLSYGYQQSTGFLNELQYKSNIRALARPVSLKSIGPQEEFFAFLCKNNSNEFSKVFEKITDSFDFFSHTPANILSCLGTNLAPVLEKSIENSGFKRK